MASTAAMAASPAAITGQKPRVMLVGLFPPAQGGVTTLLLNLMNSNLANVYRFDPYSISRPPKKNVVDNWGYAAFFRGGIRRIAIGVLMTAWRLLVFPFAVLRRHIDIVQVHASDYQQFWEAAIYVAMARALHRPVLLRLEGAFDLFYAGSSPWMKKRIRRAIERPDMLIVLSEYWREVLAGVGRTEGVIVLNNFILEKIVGAARTTAQTPPTCIFIAGSEARRKGLYVLLDALRRLQASNVPVRIVMVAVQPTIAESIRAAGFGGLVEVRGHLSQEEIFREMRLATIFLMPSFGEGLPISLLEAMAQGMAAVVTPVGAIPEVIGDGDGVIVVPPGDPAALAAAIDQLIASPDACLKMGAYNQEIVRARFVASAVLSTLDRAYRRLLT